MRDTIALVISAVYAEATIDSYPLTSAKTHQEIAIKNLLDKRGSLANIAAIGIVGHSHLFHSYATVRKR